MFDLRNLISHFAVLLILGANVVFAQNSARTQAGDAEFFGKFNAELIPDTRQLYRITLKPTGNSASYKFTAPASEKDSMMTAGKVFDLRKPGGSFETVLLEPARSLPSICVDVNADKTFHQGECFVMVVSKDNPNDFEYTLKLPIKNSLFSSLPIFLRCRRGFESLDLQPGERVLMQSLLSCAAGRVDLKNRSVTAHYQFNAADGTISTTDGLMGVDVDGDGKIKNEPFSMETSAAMNDEIVFRLGDLYLSTGRLDAANNQS